MQIIDFIQLKTTETHNVVQLSFFLSFFFFFCFVLFKKWMNTEKSMYLESEEYPFLPVLEMLTDSLCSRIGRFSFRKQG